jgi:adenylate cyclase, class 2
MREIEIKLRAKNLDALRHKLNEQGCVLSSPIRQHDTVYSRKEDANKDFWKQAKEGDIVLRIRRMDDIAEFNLKQQRSNEMDNLEYETEVDDPEAMRQILLTMGYVPEVEVRKMRQKGKLGKYEICLDEVEELGTFVELEALEDDDVDPEKIRDALFSKLETLGLSRDAEETRGYDTQMYQLQHETKKVGERK